MSQNDDHIGQEDEHPSRTPDALRSATITAAHRLGVRDRSVIAPGKLADIVAVPGNPLEDVKQLPQVCFVLKDGVVAKTAVP
ncbi:MAG: amidohydrolase family protein [Phycisphaerae bacterium]|nr:amidohydrolase family protein [Phycisphaerae bacterium]